MPRQQFWFGLIPALTALACLCNPLSLLPASPTPLIPTTLPVPTSVPPVTEVLPSTQALPETTASPIATGQAEPILLELQGVTEIITEFKHAINGEVVNNSDVAVEFIQITATYLDSDDNAVGEDFTYTRLDVIQPGGKSPFTLFPSTSEGWQSYQLAVTAQPASVFKVYHDIALSDVTLNEEDFLSSITGTATNSGSQSVSFVMIVATYYAANGDVLGSDIAFAGSGSSTLAPDAALPFEILLTTEPDAFDSYELQVQATLVQ